MGRLRARHWLAVTTAAVLIVVAARADVTVSSTSGTMSIVADVAADAAASTPDQLAAAEPEPEPEVPPEDEPTEAAPPAGPLWPLTGLPANGGDIERPVLMMKIDNHPNARRGQTGLELADLVFDVRAEVVTRFAAVFHTNIPNPVGPVRSSRTSDFDLLLGFDTPLYGSSGGNDYVASALRRLPIVALTNLTRQEYFRDGENSAPHNLFVNADDLYALAPDDLPPPGPWFEYRLPGEALPAGATPVAGPVTVDFTGSSLVTHTWDEDRAGWLRTQDGEPQTSIDGEQLAPENVVVMVTDYSTSPADAISPEVRSTGTGEVIVLTDGHAITGTWERPDATEPPTLLSERGEVIRLTPGRTWILMPETGQTTIGDG
ncbi:MAG: DUF3048 domain-containing protein [Actinomycetota bacterium]